MRKLAAFGFSIVAAALLIALAARSGGAADQAPARELSPLAVVASPDGKALYVACATGRQIQFVDPAAGKVTKSVAAPAQLTGLAISADGARLFATCAEPNGSVLVIDANAGTIAQTLPAGSGACGPVFDAKANRLYVCNRFNNDVSVIDLAAGKEVTRIPVLREPTAAALGADGRLVVSNLLPNVPASADVVSASVSIIDTAASKVAANIALPSGCTALRAVAVSPDGKLAVVTHLLGRFTVPTTQLERGWMNTNAISLIDVPNMKLINTVLLDDVDSGAANPWGAAFSPDGKTLCIAHAGTHEVSLVNIPGVLEKLAKATAADVPNDLSFLVDLRRRIKVAGFGPRGIAIANNKAYAAQYFSDSLAVIDLAGGTPTQLELGPKLEPSVSRKGERLFNDASICFQGWQSCESCHPDARVDSLNWDLLNDGLGNPKNTKSMLLAHRTPPSMSLAIRDTAETAVRSGIRYILFAVRPEEEAVAIDTYLKDLKPVPSPMLVNGKLSEAAQRGQKLFNDQSVGCANCHSGEFHTNLKPYDVGTRGMYDKENDTFDTPTLTEVWRTAPYLHDGSAMTIRDLLTTGNKNDRHGHTSQLSKEQIDDLAAYILSL